MSEYDAISAAPEPRTRESLAQDLRLLGLTPGDTVLVHSSLKSLGWVCGGSVAVVQALIDVVTPDGTLVMPTHSSDLSDPADWGAPPVPEEWWLTIRETMPAYDPRLTPTRGMGRIAETFRTGPGVSRSAHPQYSFVAWGKDAAFVTDGHALDYALGERSPLARVHDLDGQVLLLGVRHDSNTSLHLAEYRASGAKKVSSAAPISENNHRVWKTFEDIDLDEEVFPKLGADFEKEGRVRIGKVGSATARLFDQRDAVVFAQGWLEKSRGVR